MKIFVIVIAVIILIVIILQLYLNMSVNKTEEQKYTVVHKEEEFEIRFYPATTIATISSNAKSYRELSSPGFQKLAGYIFGGNEEGTKISMTKPVQMDINDSMSTMSFVMPSEYNDKKLPKPNDPAVTIKKTSDEYVATIQFGGFASENEMKLYSEKLKAILDKKGIPTYGNYRFLGYNPPFQLTDRRNEIIVSVKWDLTSKKL